MDNDDGKFSLIDAFCRKRSPTPEDVGVTIGNALVVCSTPSALGGRVTLQVRLDAAVAEFAEFGKLLWVFVDNNGGSANVLDIVELSGCKKVRGSVRADQVRVLRSARNNDDFLALERIPRPLPSAHDQVGDAFVMFTGSMVGAGVAYKQEPGLTRKWTLYEPDIFKSMVTGKQGPVVRMQFEHREWTALSEVSRDMPKWTFHLPLWETELRQLPGLFSEHDLHGWLAIAKANPIPFYAIVGVINNRYTNAGQLSLQLKVRAIRWELRSYVEAHCLRVSSDEARNFVSNKNGTGPSYDGVVNMTTASALLQGEHADEKWHFFALSAAGDGVQRVQDLKPPVHILAMERSAPSSSSSSSPSSSRGGGGEPINKRGKV